MYILGLLMLWGSFAEAAADTVELADKIKSANGTVVFCDSSSNPLFDMFVWLMDKGLAEEFKQRAPLLHELDGMSIRTLAQDCVKRQKACLERADRYEIIGKVLEQEVSNIAIEHHGRTFSFYRTSRPRPIRLHKAIANNWEEKTKLLKKIGVLRNMLMPMVYGEGQDEMVLYEKKLNKLAVLDYVSVCKVGVNIERAHYGLHVLSACSREEMDRIMAIKNEIVATRVLPEDPTPPKYRAQMLVELFDKLDEHSSCSSIDRRDWPAIIRAYSIFGELDEPERSERIAADHGRLYAMLTKVHEAIDTHWEFEKRRVQNPDDPEMHIWVEWPIKKEN